MLDISIAERRIQDGHENVDKDQDETEFDGDNVQSNVDQKSCEEQSITDDSDSATKIRDQEITKTREIHERTESMMKESCTKSD